MEIWFYGGLCGSGGYAQKVAVIPSFLHNPPLVYNHTPLLSIVKTSPFAGAIGQLTIDFAGIFKKLHKIKTQRYAQAERFKKNLHSPHCA
jgi:hypothetical protein